MSRKQQKAGTTVKNWRACEPPKKVVATTQFQLNATRKRTVNPEF